MAEVEPTAESLAAERCTACRRDSPVVTAEEVAALSPLIPDWERIEVGGVPRLRRTFRFPDYAASLAFVNRVAALAEDEGHHPSLLLEWGRVRVTWWTHAIRNLHRNDYVMAAKTDEVARRQTPDASP